MDSKTNQDKSRLSGVVLNALDDSVTTDELARQAYQSRTQFHRLFRAVVEETPAAMRRRLLLERAAFQLGQTEAPVIDYRVRRNLRIPGSVFTRLP